ncbi:MAG: phage coat protein [Aliivibrio sp.]|uniref:major coat protein n=1 Tax=Aliivibrio sp. TaxID=1872443 RepID=UPI001A502DD0|nr:phage coat protein [Aliivibrio sp.]
MKIMNMLKKHGSKLAIGGSLLVGSASANAALAPGVTAAFTSLNEMATEFIGQAWVIVPVVVIGFAGIKLFKKAVGAI